MFHDIEHIKALTIFLLSGFENGARLHSLIAAIFRAEYADDTSLALAFEEMADDGLITLEKSPTGTQLCRLSPKGRLIVPEASQLIAAGVRNEVGRTVKRFYEELTGGPEYVSETEPAEDGGTYLICKAFNDGKTTAEIRMYFSLKEEALAAKRNFEKRPQAVINAVTASVTGNADFML